MARDPMAPAIRGNTSTDPGTAPLDGEVKHAIPPNDMQRAPKDGSETQINAALKQARRAVR